MKISMTTRVSSTVFLALLPILVIQTFRSRQGTLSAVDRLKGQPITITPASYNMDNLIAGDPPSLGPTTAPVTMVIFSDFQCPSCRQFARILEEIEPEEEGRMRVIFRHFPLPGHSHARQEAELLTCIARQSHVAFWEIHDYLFTQTVSEGDPISAVFSKIQSRHDVNIHQFRSCVTLHEAATQVETDIRLGKDFGVRGTPTMFINGVRIVGFHGSAAALATIVEESARIREQRR